MKSVFIMLLATIIALVVIFLAGYLLILLNLNGASPNDEWHEVRVKRSELDATVQKYGLNSEEELREYLWFNCGTVLIVEEE